MHRRRFLRALLPDPASDRLPGNHTAPHLPLAISDDALDPYTGPWTRRHALHLVRRCVLAPTVEEWSRVGGMTLSALLDELLAPRDTLPGPSRFVGEAVSTPLLPLDDNDTSVSNSFTEEMRRWWIGLMVNDGLSIRERMTLFWHNHFAVQKPVIPDPRTVYQQNQLFRTHAIGNFKTLVQRVTVDKAMLVFLDGRYSKSGYHVNENYARELLELFTLGVTDNEGNANYTQEDVREAARALTGWDWVGYSVVGDVVCNALTGHDITNKQVLGSAIVGGSEGWPELIRLTDIIFEQEQAARYVVRKLYRFLVYTDHTLTPVAPIDPEIEAKIIAPLAQVFRAANWEIAPVLRRLLGSQHFFDPELLGGTVKSPVDLLAGTVRATRTGTLGGDSLDFMGDIVQKGARVLGQELFNPPGVQGWSFYRGWITGTTLPQRQDYTDRMLGGITTRIVDRLNLLFTGPIYRNGTWRLDALVYARQFPSFNDADALVPDIAEHLLAYPPSAGLLARLKNELVGDRAYEWPGMDDALKRSRLEIMLRVLMRSANYQLL